MNTLTTTAPSSSGSNQLLDDIKDFAHRDPVAATAAAFGAGLVITVLPMRSILGVAALAGATLLKPTLLTLGVIKGLELCCKKSPTDTGL